jgi:hypothetical protein
MQQPQAQNKPGQPQQTDPNHNLLRSGTAVSQQPLPIDAPDLKQFLQEYNTPGSAYHVSPAKRILQSFLTGIMAGPGALAAEGFNPARQQKYEEWKTDQQRVMEAQHWNAQNNVQYMRQAAINARAAQREQLQRDQMTMKDSEFQQRYGISKAQLQLAQQKQADYLNLQDKKMKNQAMTKEEKTLDQAYPMAMQQGYAQYLSIHPGATMEDALSDPSFLPGVQQRFEQMKPQANYNAALQHALTAGDLAGVDPSNQAAVYKAIQGSNNLSQEEKNDVATFLMPQMMNQGNALQKVDEANKGRVAAANISANKPTVMYVPNDDGTYTSIPVRPGTTGIPGNAMTASGVNTLSTPTGPTRSMAEVAPRVIGFVDRISTLLDNNEKQLGPLQGRWNEFKQGKLGLPNQGMAQVRTNLSLLETALMRMHVGARGGEQMMEHFHDMIGGLKQNPENIRAALGEIRDYAVQVAGERGPQAPPAPAPAAPAGKAAGPKVENWVRDPKTGKLVKQ